MKIMTYNILCGGYPMGEGEARLDQILALIKIEQPDILAIQEANGFEDSAQMQAFSQALGLPHHVLAQAMPYQDGKSYHVAVFSRYPINRIHRFPECVFQSAAISMQVDAPGAPLFLCNLHLHAYSEQDRTQELVCILAHLNGLGDQVILGDLNAISRHDTYSKDETEFERLFDVTDRLSMDYMDVFAHFGSGPPWTHPSWVVADHDRKISRRIDYIFVSDSLGKRMVNARIIRSDLAHRASDHFPLIVEMR